MPTLALEQARGTLAEIIDPLPPGEDIVPMRGGQPIATIRASPPRSRQRLLGTLRGSVLSVAADFDPVPDGFDDYLP